MPPSALHHFANTSAESNSSWFNPGRITAPASENVAILMESDVTPVDVAPPPLPFWQTSLSVPKSALAARAAPEVDDVVEPPPPDSLSLRPQAASTNASETPTASPPRS